MPKRQRDETMTVIKTAARDDTTWMRDVQLTRSHAFRQSISASRTAERSGDGSTSSSRISPTSSPEARNRFRAEMRELAPNLPAPQNCVMTPLEGLFVDNFWIGQDDLIAIDGAHPFPWHGELVELLLHERETLERAVEIDEKARKVVSQFEISLSFPGRRSPFWVVSGPQTHYGLEDVPRGTSSPDRSRGHTTDSYASRTARDLGTSSLPHATMQIPLVSRIG